MFSQLNLPPRLFPCLRFAVHLAMPNAKLGAKVDRYSFFVRLLPPLLHTGLARRTNIPISNNVGEVKHYVRTPPHAPVEERHFALVVGLRVSNLGSLLNRSGSGTQSDPAISSISHSDHDYLFRLPWFGERDAQSLRR